MNNIKSRSLTLLFIAALFLPACIIAPAITPAAAQTPEPVKIGVFGPFTTAGLSFYAPWTKQGFELGLIYATAEMGYDNENKTSAGRPYEITYYDTQGSTTVAASLAVTAIETDGIDILV